MYVEQTHVQAANINVNQLSIKKASDPLILWQVSTSETNAVRQRSGVLIVSGKRCLTDEPIGTFTS
jgi:hypothetical protein